ncbi:MAG TPA: sulfite exporter TauE/SafE family protein [Rhodopila sp.]|uniref:sulfite exporter TauE/SafE family protein n=1 Tax=Rhodopila sp. TaxID=2480087 RepID=UPI002B85C1C3|nr:sulfite exporter TauE/SafE family protein [Rhodopila sp.]HVY15171.1 sulfite exporter TauE/SafE family protein [Rhodopila sp.]
MIYSLLTALIGVFAAAVLRGFTGFGFGLASVPLLSLALPPKEVVPLVVVLQVAIGLMGLRSAAKLCDWRAVGTLLPGLLVGVPIGLTVLTGFAPNAVRLAIGLIILASVGLVQQGLRLPPRPSWRVGAGVGMVSGIISGLASMGGTPVVVYLLAIGHSASRMRATTIVYFMLSGCASLVPMVWRGLITRDVLIWAVTTTPILFLGTRLGTWAFHRARPVHHRMTALATLTVLGVALIGRALLG